MHVKLIDSDDDVAAFEALAIVQEDTRKLHCKCVQHGGTFNVNIEMLYLRLHWKVQAYLSVKVLAVVVRRPQLSFQDG